MDTISIMTSTKPWHGLGSQVRLSGSNGGLAKQFDGDPTTGTCSTYFLFLVFLA